VIQTERSASAAKRGVADKSLAESGYTKIRFVGERYAVSPEAQAVAEAICAGRTLATHMRRGHFRHQPYGTERALRKVIFIPPVLVNPGQEMPGKIYEI